MANSLLDFVMSLVRDPDAAASYAANPSQAIADAHLAGVTSVDVNNLIPMVTESLTGADGFGAEPAGNVWASGAATAAFDAFGDQSPAAAPNDIGQVVDHVITQPDHVEPAALHDYFDTGIDAQPVGDSVQVEDPSFDIGSPAGLDDVGTQWAPPTIDDHHHDDGGASFDLFN